MHKYLYSLLFFLTGLSFSVKASMPADTTKIHNQQEGVVEPPQDYKRELPAKVIHAEPLYIDLIRDLGARKGEKEWNVGFGMNPNGKGNDYEALIEYEWAPIDRLGLEVELPFKYNFSRDPENTEKNRMEGLKTAVQWSFFVSEKMKTTFALGYINELEITSLSGKESSKAIGGNTYNPFFVAAKRWGKNFHTLLYTGPMFEHDFCNQQMHTIFQINSNIHYMFGNTRHFVGLEVNQEVHNGNLETVLRPQVRYEVSEKLMIGFVTGIPVNRVVKTPSAFFRLIYEPEHK
ncbi:MAG: phosphoribosylformylglycinamidine synthase [Bacteroidetes bacterium]|nr:phosphoribosylformylglycinamidine synthase [Bacteroidota bacterium]